MDRAFTIRIYSRNFITNQNRDISRIPILIRHGCAKFVKRSTNCNIPINTCIFITQLNSLKPLLTIRLSDQRIARTSCMLYNGDKVKKKKKRKKTRGRLWFNLSSFRSLSVLLSDLYIRVICHAMDILELLIDYLCV